jgi:hypothetical protein
VSKEYSFFISHPGERKAGLAPYIESISVLVESASPDDETDADFVIYFKECLEEWFSGADIIFVESAK